MGPLVGETELPEALLKAGKDLLEPHSSTESLLDLLHKVEALLSTVEQDPIVAVQSALRPSMKALVSADLLRNPDSDVRVYVVSCLTEIMRITAPEAPYNDGHMKDIFEVTVEAFGKLADASSRSYKKAEAVLDTVAKVRSSLVMLDLECDDVILEMFRQFLKVISPDHPQPVLHSMETIMITVIDESEEVSMDLLEILLAAVKKENQDVSAMASGLVEKVLSSCACTLRPCIMEALKSTGISLDMYSPVVLSICQSEAATTEAHIVVNPKEIEAVEKIEEQVVPSDPLQEKMDLGLSVKGARSKRTARGGTRANGDDKVTKGNDLQQLLKQGPSESTETETESESTRRRGRKPNSLMNPEEGYSFKTSSSKKDSSRRKLAGKKASSPSKVGQTNQSLVISLSPSSRSKKGSGKRSRSKMEETNPDAGSLARPVSKKQTVKKDKPEEEEEDLMETDLEKPEDSIKKTAKPSKKEKRAENGSEKTSAKKPLAEPKTSGKKTVHSDAKKNKSEGASMDMDGSEKTSAKKPLAEPKTSGKKTVHSDAKKNKSEIASMDTDVPQSSKNKKNSRATTPATKEPEQAPKSHPKSKQTAGEEKGSNKSKLGQELVGKRVKVWWPLDETFYEGVIQSYDGRTKRHQVLYSDGEAEAIYLKNETWEIIQDNSPATEEKEDDLPDSTPLSDIMRRQKAKKSKNVSMDVEPNSSSDVRSQKEKEPVTNSTKKGKRTKGALKEGLSNVPESREEKDVNSSKEPKAKTGRTKKRQKVTEDMHRESEKDCDDKEEAETKGADSLKSDAEPECKRDHQELADDPNAETKTDGEELKSADKSNAEPETDGEEQEIAKEASAEVKIDGEEREPLKERNEEPESEVQEGESAKEPSADTKLIEKEDMSEIQDGESAKEPSADTKSIEKEDMSEEQEGESAKEPIADTKSIEKEDIPEEQSHGDAHTNVPETGKVENEAEEEDQRAVKEQEEETAKAEVGATPVSG
ncbi:sister chromatid cohesion protein PDS5 homolog E isoform X2 [Raphanus sativus]|uniref:Sister chromatid cohesion protein PDS5 homolog E isoform X2 n=1 Tax=Raphanus sativus TaxID=3726 RepID=A0A9W3C1W2_RAPSA|nr:sister chromatid cohesion protein PDS5 homolog E isoform X2 [Raphanus sativus]